eukprot:TRINITY_DN29535_c0_g1_i1.p1 TRINITY_DN29535_c0_g1~~TRINITY_DN29535_c0_g1_i1.p1  ORF type:complete len:2016 (-),score=372.84 TRINITY_DN29535_c0_g1_i1:304-5661(-)
MAFPTYQELCLQKLPAMKRLDDIQDMQKSRQLAAKMVFDLRRCDDLALENTHQTDRAIQNSSADTSQAQAEASGRRFADVARFFSRALANPTEAHVCVAGITRITHDMYKTSQVNPSDLRYITEEMAKNKQKPEDQVGQMIGDAYVLFTRTVDEHQCSLILRALAKLSAVNVPCSRDHRTCLGDKCIEFLANIACEKPEFEIEIIGMVEEIIILPLLQMNDEKQKPPNPAFFISILSKFSCPNAAIALKPDARRDYAKLVASLYCKTIESSDNKAAEATEVEAKSEEVAEEKIPKHEISLLVMRLTESVENVEIMLEATTSTEERNIAMAAVAALQAVDTQSLAIAQSSSVKKLMHGDEVTLSIVRNLAKAKLEAISKAFESKTLHVTLLKKLIFIFGDRVPTPGQQHHDAVRANLQQPLIRAVPTITCILDILDQLIRTSPRVCEELLEGMGSQNRELDGLFLQYVLAAPRKAAQEVDPDFKYPSILTSSLRIIHFLLTCYHEKEGRKKYAIITTLVESSDEGRMRRGKGMYSNEPCGGLCHMATLINLCDDKQVPFIKAWNAVVAERSGSNDDAPLAESARLLTLEEPRMLALLLAVINLMTFFTLVNDESGIYDKAKEVVDSKREDLMLKMILVRNEEIKVAALQCLRAAGPEKTSPAEVSQLIGLLEVKKEDMAYSLSYLEKIIIQLHRLLEFESGKTGSGPWALRSQLSTSCVEGVVSVLVKAARFVASTGKERELQLVLLSACTAFLKSASRITDWRLNLLRTKSVTHSVVAALQAERPANLKEPDICVERTWPGRAIEILLLTFSGPDRPVARGRVAFRILSRIADVLLGTSDKDDQSFCNPPDGHSVLENIIEELARIELEPWDEVEFEARRGQMNDIEEADWNTQQNLFGTSNGLDRLLMFLDGLFESESDKQSCRVRETSIISNSHEWVEEISNRVMDREKAARTGEEDGDGRGLTIKDGSDGEEDVVEEVVSDAPKLSFAKHDFSGEDYDTEDLTQTTVERFGGAMSILVTLRWDEFRYWSSVLDFGNGPGQDNIVIANQGNTNSLVFEIYNGTKSKQVILPGVLQKDEMMMFLFTFSQTGVMRIHHKGEIVGESRADFTTQPNRMKFLYLGKSCWNQRANFKGRIEDLKIWIGKCLDWEDVVEDTESEGEADSLDRRLTSKAFLSVDLNKNFHLCRPELPRVSGTATLLKSTFDSNEFNDEIFSTDHNQVEGLLNIGLPLAAMLRCCFAMVKMPADAEVKSEIVASLRDKTQVARVLTLLRLTGPFPCGCAMKFFRVMSIVLELEGSIPDVDILATYDLLMSYAVEVAPSAVTAMKQTENERLAKRGRDTGEAMMEMVAVISTSLPYCLFSDEYEKRKDTFLSDCFSRLISQQFIRDMAQMDLYASQLDGQLSQLIKTVMVETLLHLADDSKANVMQVLCAELLSSNVTIGPAILSDLLEDLKQAQETRRLEAQLAEQAYGTQKITLEGSNPERTVASARVEVFLNQARVVVYNSSHETPSITCVMTNKSLSLTDVTVSGYPDSNSGVVNKWELSQLLRLIKSPVPQGLYLSFPKNKDSNEGEDIVALVFHRQKDRDKFLGKLQKLQAAPMQEDTLLQEALWKLLPDSFTMAVYSDTEEGYFFVDRSSIRLFVFAQGKIHEFLVHLARWLPNPDRPAIEDSPEELARSRLLNAQDMLSVQNWSRAKAELVTVASQAQWVANIDKVAFWQDQQRPRIEYTYKRGDTSSIIFYDDSTFEAWRELLQRELQAEEGNTGWARITNGAAATVSSDMHS